MDKNDGQGSSYIELMATESSLSVVGTNLGWIMCFFSRYLSDLFKR